MPIVKTKSGRFKIRNVPGSDKKKNTARFAEEDRLRLERESALGNKEALGKAEILAKRGEDETFDYIDDLRSKNRGVRYSAAYSLANLKSKKLVPFILDALKSEKNPGVKFWLIFALDGFLDKNSLPIVQAFLKDKDPSVRESTTQSSPTMSAISL